MSDPSSSGWRLSQEQLGFLEELLGDAILERADANMRAAMETVREELKASLLEELGDARGQPGDWSSQLDEDAVVARLEKRLPTVDEEELQSRLESRVQELLESCERELRDAVALEQISVKQAEPELPADLVRAEELNSQKAWVRDQVAELAVQLEALRSSRARVRSVPTTWRLVVPGLALLTAAFAAGWVALEARVESSLTQRQAQLSELSGRAQSASEQITSRADAAESLFKDINQAAAEIRNHANAQAVRQDLVQDLVRNADFVAATTGPRGPVGPVGVPEGVGLAPGRFSFQNDAGATVAALGQDETGRGYAQIFGQSGAEVAYLGTDDGADGAVRVRDISGASEVSLQAGRESTSLDLSTARGEQAFVRIRNGRSAEMGVANQSGDGGVMMRSQGGLGSISVNGMSVHDFAEVFEFVSRSGVVPGTVMSVAGPDGKLGPSTWAYDPSVIGVVSGAGGLRPGLTIGTRQDGSQDLPVAMSGQVFVRVNGEGGPIQVGDLLVGSTTPGVAMRGSDVTRLPGAVIGKSMGSVSEFPGGEAMVRMFVMVR